MTTRMKKIQKKLSEWNVDALYVSLPRDLFYLTGLSLSKGGLLIAKDRADLVVDGRYFESCKGKAALHTHLDAKDVLAALLQSVKKIGFDGDAETFSSYGKLQKLAPQVEWVSLSKPVHELRIIKDEAELKKIEAACKLCTRGFDYLVSQIREGITEKELARALEIFWLQEGGDTIGFEPIIAFGKNSAYPHYRAGSVKLQKNELILIDIGVMLDGYHSDMTRVCHFGTVDPRLVEIGLVVQAAQAAAFRACKAGVYTSELDTIAREYIQKAGFGEYFVHGLGHGVGLDIHELPILKKDPSIQDVPLQAGMVVTLEPGIYLPGVGGVRIEDTVIVQEECAINLIDLSHQPLRI